MTIDNLATQAALRGLRLMPASSLHESQRDLLELLLEEGPAITSRLARLRECTTAALREAMRPLMRDGLVARRRLPHEGQRGPAPYLYSLTEAGAELACRSIAEGL